MATFFAITVIPNPVTVTTSNPAALSYLQLVQTLVYTSYRVTAMYLKAGSFAQLNQAFNLRHITPTGNSESNTLIPIPDPEQYQAVLNLDIFNNQLDIDNFTTIAFTLMPNETVEMKMEVDASSFGFLLDPQEITNEQRTTILKSNEQREMVLISNSKQEIAFKAAVLIIATLLIYAGGRNNT